MTAGSPKIYDISPPISARTGVWPGDVALHRSVQMDHAHGAHLTLSSITSTVHIGAHADAPSHYHKDGASIDQVELSAYIGPCTVLHVTSKPLITVGDLAPLRGKSPCQRVLFKTLSQPDPQVFNEDFTAFSAEAIEALAGMGVVLVGIDTPSVDPFASKDLPAHVALFRNKIRNLEGLDLRAISPGDYELIALPLALSGFDASPVRAILRR